MQERGGARVGKGKKGVKGREEARGRKKKGRERREKGRGRKGAGRGYSPYHSEFASGAAEPVIEADSE